MKILGDRRFVEIPGERLHELPPLMVRTSPKIRRLDKVVDMASEVADDLLPEEDQANYYSAPVLIEKRRMDLAINLVEQYMAFVQHWQWGDGILDWIRHCETQFQITYDLRGILRPDVWPHASRCSFVTLLTDKSVRPDHVDLEKAVGMRLTFRQPPPIKCFSNQFLFYLNSSVATTAYKTWSHMAPSPISSLPPERFTFLVVAM
jgi:hypothetical protein